MTDLSVEQIKSRLDDYNAVNARIADANRAHEETVAALNQQKLDIEEELAPFRELLTHLGIEFPGARKRRSTFGVKRGPRKPRNVDYVPGNSEEHQNPEFAA